MSQLPTTKPGEPELLVAALPGALRRLRLRAGHRTLRSAATAIQQKTGLAINAAMLSNWERVEGHTPRVDSLMGWLSGLGFTFRDLQDELERASGELAPTCE